MLTNTGNTQTFSVFYFCFAFYSFNRHYGTVDQAMAMLHYSYTAFSIVNF